MKVLPLPRACRRRVFAPVLIGGLVTAIAGCRESWQAAVYPATGKVSINGQPAAGVLVQLVPAGQTQSDVRGSRPWGLVKDNGSFFLSTYDGEPGAPAGEYRVTMTWPPDASRPSTEDRLHGRYARSDLSALNVTIRPEENVLQPIEITDAKVAVKPPQAAAAPPAAAGPMLPPLATNKARRVGRGR